MVHIGHIFVNVPTCSTGAGGDRCLRGDTPVLAPKWEDFDAEAHTARVRRSLYRGELNDPKTEESERTTPYSGIVREALEHLEKSDRKNPDFLVAKAVARGKA
jgi:hypothetical protein